jgi:hypothetical protein
MGNSGWRRIFVINRNTKSFLDADKEVDLEVDAEENEFLHLPSPECRTQL